jgi:cobalt-zinc-cadmium efflux system protein
VEPHPNPGVERRFLIAIGLTAIILLAEAAGGIWTHSLALLSDAAHVLLDLFAIALSYLALRLSALPPDDRHTYGYHRLEVLAALANGLTLLVVAGGILWESYERWQFPQAVRSLEMLVIAIVGLLVNVAVALLLTARANADTTRRADLNVRSAALHAMSDAVSSVGVIAAALIIALTGWQQADALAGALIGLLILLGAGRVLRSSLHILIEGTPEGMSVFEVGEVMTGTPGVCEVHDLHVWSLCSSHVALSAHIMHESSDPRAQMATLREMRARLQQRFGITHTTVQIDEANCGQGAPIETAAAAGNPV